MVGGGGGRTLRRVDISPRPTLYRSDSIRKKKGRKRSRISAALRDLGMAARGAARDKDGLLHLLVTGHRRGRGGSAAGGGKRVDRGVAAGLDDDRPLASRSGAGGHADTTRELVRRQADTGTSGAGARRCCASWALAVALVLALACVVALGKAPAICCCICAAWLCGGGAYERASERPRADAAGPATAVAAGGCSSTVSPSSDTG